MNTTIVSLTAENVKRLKAVKVTPSGAIVTVGGRNGQGKSSLLDCIAMALGGKDAVPPEPIRRGQSKAKIVLETQELIVTRKFTAGGSTLEVQNKAGLRFPSPQAVLDNLCASLAFDPLSFVRADRKAQLTQLRALVGVDTSLIEADRGAAFDSRTEVNRRVKSQAAVVQSLPESGPAAVSVDALLAALTEAEKVNAAAEALRQEAGNAGIKLETAAQLRREARGKVEYIEREIARLTQELEGAKAHESAMVDSLLAVRDLSEKALEKSETAPRVDVSPIKEKIANAGEVNREAAKVVQRKAEAAKLASLEKESGAWTKTIEAFDKEKEDKLAAAKFPVEGLGFDANGITFNGIPFEQSSSAEQLRVGLAIACGMNPSLRVMLIRDGSLLDEDSLRLVAETAEAHDAQVWLERVGNDGKCTVVIEDGSAVEDAEVAA